MIKTFVLMGLPGSGKGKQSELLAEKLKCKIFSTGVRVREIAQENSSFGHKIKEIHDSGDLTPSWFASFLFEEAYLALDNNEAIIFEGLGRIESEARLFAEISEWLGRDFRVIYLDVSEQSVIERLNKRRGIEGRADDSNIQNRFDNFNAQTIPALNYFRSLNKVIDIDGEPLPDAVFAELWQKVSTL